MEPSASRSIRGGFKGLHRSLPGESTTLALLILAMIFLSPGCVTGPSPVSDAVAISKEPIEVSDLKLPPLGISRIEIAMEPGKKIGYFYVGLIKRKTIAYTIKSELDEKDQLGYQDALYGELEKAGYEVLGKKGLFETTKIEDARFLLGGSIIDHETNVYSSVAGVQSEASYTIEWKIYDNLKKQVIYKSTTSGYGLAKDAAGGHDYKALTNSFRNFLADTELIEALKRTS